VGEADAASAGVWSGKAERVDKFTLVWAALIAIVVLAIVAGPHIFKPRRRRQPRD